LREYPLRTIQCRLTRLPTSLFICPDTHAHDCTSPSQGVVGDMKDLGITESFRVKSQVVASASEAAEMILRVDDILKSAPRQRTR
jgi:hypothetical protein